MVIKMNGVQFVWNHKRISMISDQNCKTRSSITILLQPFWNRKIQSLRYRMFLSGQMFYWSSGELVYRKLIKLFLVSCNLVCSNKRFFVAFLIEFLHWLGKRCDLEQNVVRFRAKHGAIREWIAPARANQITRSTSYFQMNVINQSMVEFIN